MFLRIHDLCCRREMSFDLGETDGHLSQPIGKDVQSPAAIQAFASALTMTSISSLPLVDRQRHS